MSILFSRLLFTAHNFELYLKILSSRLLKIISFTLAVVFLFWNIVLTELYARFVRIFLFWKSSSVPSLFPISLQFLQLFCPFFLMVYAHETTTTTTEGSTPRFRLIRICNPKIVYSVLSLSLIQAFLCFCLLVGFSVRLDR